MNRRMKTLTSVLAACLLLGCTTAPTLKFPTGEHRVPINAVSAAAGSASAPAPTTPDPTE
jgi:hypothetical protein